jgi:hypothetical protein
LPHGHRIERRQDLGRGLDQCGRLAMTAHGPYPEIPTGGDKPRATSPRVAAPRHRSPQRIRQSCPASSCTRQPSIRSSAGASRIGRRQPAHRCRGARSPCSLCQRFCSSPHANHSAAARL